MSRIHDHDFHLPVEKGPATHAEAPAPNSPLAVVSLVFGILGMTALPAIGSVIAIATGHAAMGQIRDEQGRVGGRALARAGMTLGYLAFAIAAVVFGIVLWFSTAAYVEMRFYVDRRDPATVHAPIPGAGVKMVNEMQRGDFALIEDSHLDIKPDEIIACFKAGPTSSDPEFALLTSHRILYLKDGRTTAFDLKDVVSLKDDEKYEASYNKSASAGITKDFTTYHIEITAKRGPRIRINIRPEDQGQVFYDALETAWKAAGGEPVTTEKAER